MYVIVDTETSGLFDYSKPADAAGQPRLAELAMLFCDADFSLQRVHHMLIKPDGWEMSAEAEGVHGLSTQDLQQFGVPLKEVISDYAAAIDEGLIIVGYNVRYDTKVMRGELRRCGEPDRYLKTRSLCTMAAMKAVMPKRRGFPKLTEAYQHAIGSQPNDAHNAIADAHSCLELAKWLRRHHSLPSPICRGESHERSCQTGSQQAGC